MTMDKKFFLTNMYVLSLFKLYTKSINKYKNQFKLKLNAKQMLSYHLNSGDSNWPQIGELPQYLDFWVTIKLIGHKLENYLSIWRLVIITALISK